MSEAENPEGRPEAAGADAQVKPQNPEAEGAEPKVEAEKKVPLPLRKLHEVRQKAFGCDIEGTAVADHSLPYRVLIEELHHRGKADEDDFRDLVAKNEKDYEALAKLKDALMPLDPLKDWDASQKALKAAKDKLSECNENDGRLKKVLHDADTFAWCFSGGGIRSASVCLGVLQGLSRNVKQMVKGVDYLSTVSGGGYIGSWLMAWSRREQHGFEAVIDEIEAGKRTSVDAEPRPLRHMREDTSFLAPRLGFTSDTIALLATVGRNMLLNLLLLVPLYAAALCVPILLMLLLTCKQLSWAGLIAHLPNGLNGNGWLASNSQYYTEWLCLVFAFLGVTLAG